ncbi:MAG: protein-L-isoaspartate O-methyltransferase [Candidatus Omnitrophica bacterium CG07_land_8_20_14_0_80_42_15]|uniref:Protein-L-isoaspartate O-methyltransferase n=1 Tax=Candidatus Aquitaenariimonas noxiae TaxID=1974741 RepID=A0A2J0KV32_9BACT|nr:MAG: protein-L-isoaspartate O-methyltransferase [Candidatus Omnitrophica bacterium CG07_land_8_20_14_0_80_42_15]
MEESEYRILRERMVVEQLIPRGIHSERVLSAFKKVPRHAFIPELESDNTYGDFPLPIGEGQTISQPYMVALMSELLELKKDEKVLEIGTGSGYQAAILAELAGKVYSVERFENLAKSAERILEKLGYQNIKIKIGDGTLGWDEYAPYDGIIVTAGAPEIPKSLLEQLAEGGRLIIPVGGHYSQMLTLVRNVKGKFKTLDICGCIFVPLVGKEAWSK